ncbi:MAG: glycosyltransferase [Planctomycetes bacterium]|nr:glycosyltransferase [Planctomycetota bacterium]
MARILVVSPTFPYPTRTGFDVRLAVLVEGLATEHEVHLLSAASPPSPAASSRVPVHVASWECMAADRDGQGWQRFARRLYRRVRRPSFVSWAYRPDRLIERIEQLDRAGDFDTIIVQTPGLAPVLDRVRHASRVIDTIDLWHERFRCFAQVGEGRLLEHYRDPAIEFDAYRRWGDLVLAISLHDEARLLAAGIERDRLLHVPVAFEPRPLTKLASEPNLLFAGASGVTNVDAVAHFVADILPRVRARVPESRLLLLRADDEVQRRFSGVDGVDILPDLDEIDDAYRRTRVAVVPLRIGTGIKIKVLESFSRGVPTLISPVAAQGLHLDGFAQNPVSLDPTTFASDVVRALTSDEYCEALRRSALRLIATHYAPAVVHASLNERISKLRRVDARPAVRHSDVRGRASSSLT